MSPSADSAEQMTRRRSETATARGSTPATAIGVVVIVYAITFFAGAGLHLGVRIPLGLGVLAEPRILPATIVESLCGLGLALSGYGVLSRRGWAWTGTVAAHSFALAGVLLGIGALAAGGGPSTTLNSVYHATMVALLSAGLVLLQTTGVKTALRGGDAAPARDRRR